MSERRFKFVSPGIFIKEIDQSRRSRVPEKRGPVIIGRFERGPTMRPITVQSFSEFLEIFGSPHPGGVGGDSWREGNKTAPLYAAYAAQAYLRNNGPVNIFRLVGTAHDDATVAGKAGWSGSGYAASTGGGAYALMVFESGSSDATGVGANASGHASGALGAILYTTSANTRFALSGSTAGPAGVAGIPTTSSAGVLIKSINTTPEFKLDVYTSAGAASPDESIVFNFNRDSDKFIRKVINTNPALTSFNATVGIPATEGGKTYFLGESFEEYLTNITPLTASVNAYAAITPMHNTNFNGNMFRTSAQAAKTGWVIAQDLGTATDYNPVNAQKLFKAVALDGGAWHQNNIKISIANIVPARNQFQTHGTFSLIVRDIGDTDANIRVLERFDNLSLDPASSNFIGFRIGTVRYEFSDTDNRLRKLGKYDNKSNLIRIELTSELENSVGLDAAYLPAGFYLPTQYKDFQFSSGSTGIKVLGAGGPTGVAQGATATIIATDLKEAVSIASGSDTGIGVVADPNLGQALYLNSYASASVRIPSASLRTTSNDVALGSRFDSYWGVDTTRAGSSRAFDFSLRDLLREKADGAGGASTFDSGSALHQEIFTLDDLSGSTSGSNAYHLGWVSGSRASGISATAAGVGPTKNNPTLLSGGFSALANAGWAKFTMPMYGGSDGFDALVREPLANALIGTSATKENSHIYNTYNRAVEIIAEKELLNMNLAIIPGLTNTALTAKLINVCEERGDALAIIDLEGGYLPVHERLSSTNESANKGSVSSTVTNLESRGMNSSYGCAYYPWVLARDTASTGGTVWLPPSVVALGVMGSSETRSELWFAPAGFNRGGLSEEAAGIPVIDVRDRLNSKDRDDLYRNNINPIASFPSEGIVVFGQKTLQVTPSALDRINVRRLMIYLKKEISTAASRILFDQNVQETWKRFIGQVRPLLKTVQARFGITDFKLVLDETTTTPDLIDRNILYAKVFVKPARAIEYIAVDFFITSTGASFEE